MNHTFVQIHSSDNVLVALQELSAGQRVSWSGRELILKERIAPKHKFAVNDLKPGDQVIMYGVVVGKAILPIPAGSAITTFNTKHQSSPYGSKKGTYHWTPPDISRWKGRTFMGYHRKDGQVGTANYWLIIPMVFCENRNVSVLKGAFDTVLGYQKPDPYTSILQGLVTTHLGGKPDEPIQPGGNKLKTTRVFPGIDGVKVLLHEGGCGGTRQDADTLCTLFANYIHHPNVAGATVLSLGCQHAQIELLESKIKKVDPEGSKPVFIFDQQQSGTEEELITRAIHKTFEGIAEANKINRQPAPLSKLVVGLKCGGSDGFSGISANPAIGHTSDLLVTLGGSTILSEFPELCGVEQELIDRCEDPAAGDLFMELMKTYSAAAEAVGSGFDMNPSPGNIKDGLITDAMKSAGAARKGGTAPVADVLRYGEYIKKSGLNLLCTPGNDVESTTGTTGSGAQIILFTTGLGTPTGNPVSQVVKLSTNTRLAQRMPDIIDFDTGGVIDGLLTIEQAGEAILDFVIEVASGNVIPKSVQLDQDDFIPWKRGVSL